MENLTQIQVHYVHGRINHYVSFGQASHTVKLDEYRSLQLFEPGQIVGYIRWYSNQYGTQDWRLFILETGQAGYLSQVPGVTPAASVLCAVQGQARMKKALLELDNIRAESSHELSEIPASFWRQFDTGLRLGAPLRALSRSYRKGEICHAV